MIRFTEAAQRDIDRAFVVGLVEGGCWVSDRDGAPLTERFKFDGDRVTAVVIREGVSWCIRDEQGIEYPATLDAWALVRGSSVAYPLPPEDGNR